MVMGSTSATASSVSMGAEDLPGSPRPTAANQYQNMIILVLALSTLLVTVFNRFRPKDWVPDSTVTVFCGIAIGFLIGSPSETDLREEFFTSFFFDLFLPPIAFAAALNESRTSISGVLFAIASTTLSTYLIGASIEYHFVNNDSSTTGCLVKGCMMWGVAMAPVSARYVLTSHVESAHKRPGEHLTFDEEEELDSRIEHPLLPTHKTLDSWLHCESLLSGPIAVVFFTSLRLDRLRGLDLDPTETMINFGWVLLGSIMFGSFLGIFSALTLRTPFEPTTRGGPYREVSLIILWAITAFFLARYMGLSAVGTLFCAGIVMKNTALRVVSQQARHTARVGSEAIAATAESFVLLYMSISSVGMILSVKHSGADLHATVVVLVACVLSRLIISALVSIVLGGGGHRSFAFLVTLLSGMRGAISFSLALKAGFDGRELLLTSAIIAIFSHAVFAPVLALYLNAKGSKPTRPSIHPLARAYDDERRQPNYDTIESARNGTM